MDELRAETPFSQPVDATDRIRASCIRHAVEDGHADSRFGLLNREVARSQMRDR